VRISLLFLAKRVVDIDITLKEDMVTLKRGYLAG